MNILRVSVVKDEKDQSVFAFFGTNIPIGIDIISRLDFMYLIREKNFPCNEVLCPLKDIVFGMEKEIFGRILINKSIGNVTGEVSFNQLMEYIVPEYDAYEDLVHIIENPN